MVNILKVQFLDLASHSNKTEMSTAVQGEFPGRKEVAAKRNEKQLVNS